MFDIDKWQEIFNTISKNKLRTILTGFSVSWGIFMLIILVGSVKGLENGFEADFKSDAINSIWVYQGQTTIPFQGLPQGRPVRFTNTDHEVIDKQVQKIDKLSSRLWLGSRTMNRGQQNGAFQVIACHPGQFFAENATMMEGRFVNQIDIRDSRKVVVIGEPIKNQFFPNGNFIGENINIDGVLFKVVGYFQDTGGDRDNRRVYIPMTTGQKVFDRGNNVHAISMMIGDADLETSQEITEDVRGRLARLHSFSPQDQRAVWINNTTDRFDKVLSVLRGINFFLTIIGVMTIIAGVVGVSNIMMVVVKERTKEIGVRKALGATPFSVVSMIMLEAVFITSIAGYIGLVGGVFTLEAVSGAIENPGIFQNPEVDIIMAIKATIVLVVAGALAGLVPAVKAAMIKPIEALREE